VLQPLSDTSPEQVRRPVFRQRWGELAMLHWPVDPALVQPLLPAGTRPDLHDGVTWVGLIPFVMSEVRVLGLPPLPWLSRFAETNVRLYATDDAGRRGVVFRSLEAARLLPVLVAQAAYALPYRWARMSVDRRDDGALVYRTSRRWPGPRGRAAPSPSGPVVPLGPTRWRSSSPPGGGCSPRCPAGRTVWAPVEHPPWPLQAAELLELDDDLVVAGGLPRPAGDPHVLFSPGVDVRFGRPVLLPALQPVATSQRL
jgi:uncharacterized protein YqjF (DUF2071 family)